MPIVTPDSELNKNLELEPAGGSCKLRRIDRNNRLIGQARVKLEITSLLPYLQTAHLTAELDKLAYYIRMLGLATPHYGHISPLHHQAARQREVIIVENPRLHLLWYYDRIFIKPIPRYMLSHSFWEFLEKNDAELWKACAGFMRTYSFLIQHEVDFKRASGDLGLIPADDGVDSITYERFAEFIEPFMDLDDTSVSPRFAFGELRLTRLNILTRIFLWKMTYHHIHAQWSTYLGRFLAPFFTLFILLTTISSSMQVELAVEALPYNSGQSSTFSRISRWFSITVLILVVCTLLLYFLLVTIMVIHDFCFAKAMEYRKRTRGCQYTVSEMKSGVV